ncbi:MAG TPA: 5-(carboxyamino)imidazole ribonucleotide synthase [Candidatus Thermoplasmatota archaeon]|nr:5-(carboxyamino)imidazole ribonucleotide synthase [Candidatus Thermoplasmatota archaeon]
MRPLLPGATVGILGGGQLGRMLTFEAHKMGFRTAVLDPARDGPAGQVADVFVEGSWSDAKAMVELARRSDVVTVETEHLPWEALAEVEKAGVALRPGSAVLRVVQDRLRQKDFLAERKLPQPRYAHVHDAASLAAAVREVGAPAVLKSLTGGYDGKGQARTRDAAGADAAWASIGRQPCIYEAFVPFEREVSVVLARGIDGEVTYYPLAENVHHRGILHTTVAPARVPPAVETEARRIARAIADALGHVGVMAVEMFLLPDGSLQVNEIAPRVHNSGHYTFGACATSQFEQHVRAICGLPLGDTTLLRPACMLNVLGDAWARGEPEWSAVLAEPAARLHLYGKKDARPGRKMGHVVVLHDKADDALRVAEAIHARLTAGAPR